MAKSNQSQGLVVRREYHFGDEGDLLNILCLLVQNWNVPALIVAGHYFLLCDSENSRLVAVLSSAGADTSLSQAEKDLLAKVGDFPVRSLKAGLHLLKAFPGRGWRIAVAVDDHQFQRVQCDAPSGIAAGELRKAYYSRQMDLPCELEEAIISEGLKVDDVIALNSSRHRSSESVLPGKTYFFSEAVHKNRFTDKRRSWLLQRPGFSGPTAFFEEGLLYFRPLGTAERLCLIGKDGRAYCSGAMVEFLFDLSARGAEAIIMFIPGGCRDDVDLAVEAFMSLQMGVREILAVWQTGVDAAGDAVLGAVTHYAIA